MYVDLHEFICIESPTLAELRLKILFAYLLSKEERELMKEA